MLYYQSLAPAKKQIGIDPEQPEKRFLFQMRHRLNRKLFFRPCQYIRERKQRRETKTGALFRHFSGRRSPTLFTQRLSPFTNGQTCALLFSPFVFSTHNRETHPPSYRRVRASIILCDAHKGFVCVFVACLPLPPNSSSTFSAHRYSASLSSPTAACDAQEANANKEWPRRAPENALRKIEPVI
jgi:hypothetical protein